MQQKTVFTSLSQTRMHYYRLGVHLPTGRSCLLLAIKVTLLALSARPIILFSSGDICVNMYIHVQSWMGVFSLVLTVWL